MSIAKHRELLVLGTLASHAMHGYALAEVLEGGLGRAVGLERSTVYAILKRLAERGWLDGTAERDGNYPERSVYRVTAAGRAALPGLALACARRGSATLLPLAAVLAQLEALDPVQRGAAVDALLHVRRADCDALAPYAGHPGPTGAAIRLQLRHLDAEVALLESLAEG